MEETTIAEVAAEEEVAVTLFKTQRQVAVLQRLLWALAVAYFVAVLWAGWLTHRNAALQLLLVQETTGSQTEWTHVMTPERQQQRRGANDERYLLQNLEKQVDRWKSEARKREASLKGYMQQCQADMAEVIRNQELA